RRALVAPAHEDRVLSAEDNGGGQGRASRGERAGRLPTHAASRAALPTRRSVAAEGRGTRRPQLRPGARRVRPGRAPLQGGGEGGRAAPHSQPGPESHRAGDGGLVRRLQLPGRVLPEARAPGRIRHPRGLGCHAGAGDRAVRKRARMNASEALGRLKRLRVPAATTADAAAVLGVSGEAASHMLRRLARSGLVTPLRKGLWALAERPDPLALAEYVTAPYPSYLSLQTALYQHGMIEQIPSMIFLVSLARTARIETGLGTFSVHHVQPVFFAGFEQLPGSGIKLARPEKALVDFLYLAPTRARLFAALPEIELPRSFRRRAAHEWVERIPSQRLRTIAANGLRR